MRTGQRDNIINNKGFSLVELVIVIAIMALLTGSGISIVVGISNAKVKSCAQSIFTDLNRVKTNTMAKAKTSAGGSDYFFSLYRSGDDVYLKETINGVETEKKIGGKGINVQYADSTEVSATRTNLGTSPIVCKFDRNSGAVSDKDFLEVFVSNNHVQWRVVIYEKTGKAKLEQL